MDNETLRMSWEKDFGGEKGSYRTFRYFLERYQEGMNLIGGKLTTPQNLMPEESALLDHLDKVDPVSGFGTENRG